MINTIINILLIIAEILFRWCKVITLYALYTLHCNFFSFYFYFLFYFFQLVLHATFVIFYTFSEVVFSNLLFTIFCSLLSTILFKHIHTHTQTHIININFRFRMLWSNWPSSIPHHSLPPASVQIHFMLSTEVCSIQAFISES